MEVREPEKIAEICAALSHPNRVHLYQILQEEGETLLSELVTLGSSALPKPLNYMTVKHHVQRMEEAGVVEIGKTEGQFSVSLARPDIRILEEPAPGEAEPEAETEAQTVQR